MQEKQRGSIIAFTLIVLSFILTSGLAVITVASLERKSGLVTQKSVVAFQAADSGAERILKRMYIDNSPSIMSVAKNGTMTDATLNDLAQNMVNIGATCDTAIDAIVATSDSTPAYTFQATFLDGSDTLIDCADATWRDKVVRMRVDGFYRQTARVIEMGIKPRPKCDESDMVNDTDGNTYDVVEIAGMCWTKQNMKAGNRINSGTAQSNNGSIEYYCYDNLGTCDLFGGLYTWDEATQYVTTEGARGICTSLGDGSSWHVPTDREWYDLENNIDPTINDPLATGFRGTNGGADLLVGGNSGFEAQYAGVFDPDNGFIGGNGIGGELAFFWTSTEEDNDGADRRLITNASTKINRVTGEEKIVAASIRCVMDQ